MKRFFLSLIAIFFPWMILLINDNPGGALIALIMQATVIGWLPASIWALRIIRDNRRAVAKIKKTQEQSGP